MIKVLLIKELNLFGSRLLVIIIDFKDFVMIVIFLEF